MGDTVSLHCILKATVQPVCLSIIRPSQGASLYLTYCLLLNRPRCPQARRSHVGNRKAASD